LVGVTFEPALVVEREFVQVRFESVRDFTARLRADWVAFVAASKLANINAPALEIAHKSLVAYAVVVERFTVKLGVTRIEIRSHQFSVNGEAADGSGRFSPPSTTVQCIPRRQRLHALV